MTCRRGLRAAIVDSDRYGPLCMTCCGQLAAKKYQNNWIAGPDGYLWLREKPLKAG